MTKRPAIAYDSCYRCLRSESIHQRNLYQMWGVQSKLGELQREFIGRLKDLVEVNA